MRSPSVSVPMSSPSNQPLLLLLLHGSNPTHHQDAGSAIFFCQISMTSDQILLSRLGRFLSYVPLRLSPLPHPCLAPSLSIRRSVLQAVEVEGHPFWRSKNSLVLGEESSSNNTRPEHGIHTWLGLACDADPVGRTEGGDELAIAIEDLWETSLERSGGRRLASCESQGGPPSLCL
jgi:hypothetical protein